MRFKRYLSYLLGFFIIWQSVAMLAKVQILPTPVDVFIAFAAELKTAQYWNHIGVSLYRIAMSLFFSLITAVPTGLAAGAWKSFDENIKPIIYLSYPVPKIVLLPLIMLIFGLGDASKIVIISLILYFQLLITTRDAARAISQDKRLSLYSLGGNTFDLIRYVIFPATLPAILTSLRIATGTVVSVLFFVESIGTQFGIGYYIIDAWGRADISQIYIGMLTLAFIGVLMYEGFDILERQLCKWNRL